MQPDTASYLRAVRRHLAGFSIPSGDDAMPILACADEIIAQMIVRDTRSDTFVQTYEAAVIPLCRALADDLGAAAPETPISFSPQAAAAIPSSQRLDQISRHLETLLALSRPSGDTFRRAAQAEQGLRSAVREQTDLVLSELRGAENAQSSLPDFNAVAAFLQPHLPEHPGLRTVAITPVGGMHAKEVYFLDMIDGAGQQVSLVMRQDREIDLTRTSVADEYPLMRGLFERGFALPEPIAAARSAHGLERAVMVMRRVGGKERSLNTIAEPRRLLTEIAEILATLHRTQLQGLGFAETAVDVSPEHHWRGAIERQYVWWRSLRTDASPAMDWARWWLLENVSLVSDGVSVVHGDFNLRNLLLTEDDRVSTVLDWELTHIGHPGEDLGYFRADVEEVMSWSDFMVAYVDAGGTPVTEAQLRYFEVWMHFRNAAFNATYQSCFLTGQTQDIFLGVAALTLYQQQVLAKLWQALAAVSAQSPSPIDA